MNKEIRYLIAGIILTFLLVAGSAFFLFKYLANKNKPKNEPTPTEQTTPVIPPSTENKTPETTTPTIVPTPTTEKPSTPVKTPVAGPDSSE